MVSYTTFVILFNTSLTRYFVLGGGLPVTSLLFMPFTYDALVSLSFPINYFRTIKFLRKLLNRNNQFFCQKTCSTLYLKDWIETYHWYSIIQPYVYLNSTIYTNSVTPIQSYQTPWDPYTESLLPPQPETLFPSILQKKRNTRVTNTTRVYLRDRVVNWNTVTKFSS